MGKIDWKDPDQVREYRRLRQKEYREKNRERLNEYARIRQKEYREKNREKVLERKRRYYEENQEICRESSRMYRKNNREKVNERSRWYRENLVDSYIASKLRFPLPLSQCDKDVLEIKRLSILINREIKKCQTQH